LVGTDGGSMLVTCGTGWSTTLKAAVSAPTDPSGFCTIRS